MAVGEEIYRSRVAPARTASLPLDDPRNSPAVAIGQGMERLGGALHQRELQDYQIQRKLDADREGSDFAVRFAEARAKFDQFSIDRRNAAPADAAGHSEAMQTAWQAESETLLQGLRESSQINNARAQLAQFGERLVSSEVDWAEGRRVAKLVNDQQQLSMIGANRARQMHDTAAYAEELAAGHQAIDALNIPADVKEKLGREHDQQVTIGYLNGLNDTSPHAAVALIDGGAFGEILDPGQIEQARNGAMVEVRRADAVAAHQQQLEAAAVRENVQGLKARIDGGVAVPDAELAQAQMDLARIGDAGGATAMGVLRVQNGVTRETEPWTPMQFDAEINRLTGKAKRTAEEDVRLAALRSQRPNAVATYNNNPGEWAARNGMPPPALDLADAGSVAGRMRWARSVEAQTGRPVNPLQPTEAAVLREQAAVSPKGRLDVANQIASFGGMGAVRAAALIAPNDPMLGRLATLANRQLRADATTGGEVRKQRKDLIDGTNGNDANGDFYDALGAAGGLLAPGQVGAAFEIARNLYAARSHSARYDQGLFDRATHEALGGTFGPNGEKLGGLGSYGSTPVLLPPGMSDATFDKRMARLPMLALERAKFRPVWQDGTAMSGAELRKNFTPVMRPDGRYEFHGANGDVVTVKGGRTWVLDIAQMARNVGE